MGRRKKKNNSFRDVGLGVLVTTIGLCGYLSYVNGDFSLPKFDLSGIENSLQRFMPEKRVQEPVMEEVVQQVEGKTDTKVKVFFIGQKDGKDIYRTVYRNNNKGCSNIEYAVNALLAGPTKYEKDKGVYSEIPPTKLLSISETSDKVIINLSSSFENGGGTDSIYKRMYQLIKTVNYNTDKPVYLFLNGRQAEAIGGEGLMLHQPLNGSSLDD